MFNLLTRPKSEFKMPVYDFILISQSEAINYDEFSRLPIDKIGSVKELIYPRMIYFKGKFRGHLDIINYFKEKQFFSDTGYPQRRSLLNIWNLPGANSLHIPNYLLQFGIKTKIINNFDAEWDLFCRAYDSCGTAALIGISTTFYLSFISVRRIAKKIREKYPDAEIVIGGAFANEQAINSKPEDFETHLRKNGINYCLYSFNSEIDLKDLIMSRRGMIDIEKVKNLAYIEKGDFIKGLFKLTEAIWHGAMLEETPVLWDKIESPFVNHTVQFRASSGCPFSCAFCSYPKTARKYLEMPVEKVERHLQSILAIPGVNKIIFIDDTFNVSAKRFKELCRMFCKYKFEWFSFLRVQFVDDEAAKLMKDSGCQVVYLGIESSNDTVLKNMNKKATRLQFATGLKVLKRQDIKSMAAFVLGFPGETAQSIRENIDFIESMGIDFYSLKEFYYMKHAPIYELRDEFKLSGMGNIWKHDTMDSKAAYAHKVEMFKSIKNSVFIDADTSLWYIAYLYDQGFSIDKIKDIQRHINEIVLAQIEGNHDESLPVYGQLERILLRNGTK